MNDSKSRFGWPHAFAVIAVVAMIAALAVAWFAFEAARKSADAVVDSGRAILHDVGEIARAFNQGTVSTTFLSYATEVTGSNYLQFASVDQTEAFERRDGASTLWGQLELPEVIVRATAPVSYTYYLDLDAEWTFQLIDDEILVVAPAIQFNKPAVDASRIEYEVAQDSLLRNEDEALKKLKAGLSGMVHQRAQQNVALVRELGRRKTEEFVENWMFRDFGESARDYRVRVVFADEQSPLPLPGRTGREPVLVPTPDG